MNNGAQCDQWPIAPPSRKDLPEGEYVVSYRSHRRAAYFDQQKIELVFEIVEPPVLAGVVLSLYATLPSGRISSASKYYALWCQANSGPPLRGDRMSPRVFRGYWRIHVKWSAPKDSGRSQPVIDALLERVAGASPR